VIAAALLSLLFRKTSSYVEKWKKEGSVIVTPPSSPSPAFEKEECNSPNDTSEARSLAALGNSLALAALLSNFYAEFMNCFYKCRKGRLLLLKPLKNVLNFTLLNVSVLTCFQTSTSVIQAPREMIKQQTGELHS